MGTTYILINDTKKEIISFPHLPVSKKREICGNPASSAIVSWYLINNRKDNIRFYSEHECSYPIDYKEVTEKAILELIENEILEDNGMEWVDEDEPDKIYIRSLKNTWMD